MSVSLYIAGELKFLYNGDRNAHTSYHFHSAWLLVTFQLSCIYLLYIGSAVEVIFSEAQGLSQHLQTGYPNLAITNFLGILFFKGNHNILRLQPLTYICLLEQVIIA